MKKTETSAVRKLTTKKSVSSCSSQDAVIRRLLADGEKALTENIKPDIPTWKLIRQARQRA